MPSRSRSPKCAALTLSAGLALAGAATAATAAASLVALAPPAWSAAAATPQAHVRTDAAAMRSSVTVKVAVVAKYGHILVDQAGMALYFDKADKPPKHWACTGGCLSAWPPLVLGKGQMAAAHAKSLTGLGAVHGPSGLQVTWDGKPLYTYVGDSKGQVSGQGLGGVWYVAQVKTKM